MRKVVIVICLAVLLSGCWDKQELEDNTFAVLLGLDKSGENDLTVTVAYPPTQLSGGKEEATEYAVMSATASSITEGLDMMSVKLAGPLALYPVKTVVISREFAEGGMVSSRLLTTLRQKQVRNTANIMISSCTAAEFINARVKDPAIDILRQEELLLERAGKSAYYKPLKLLDLFINLNSDGADSAAMYGGIAETMEKSAVNGYLPGEMPVKADNETQICGMAVFRRNKMVGTLNSSETQTLSMLTTNKARKTLNVANPDKPSENIAVTVQRVSGGIRGRILEERAVFDIDIGLRCEVEHAPEGCDTEALKEYVKETCISDARDLIEKLQQELNADVLRLGNKLRFKSAEERRRFDWREKYADAEINVTITFVV